MFLPHWASQAITKDWTYLASPASLILTNNQGRLFVAVIGFSAFKLAAALLPRSGTGLAEGETGQAEPDWPALADWLPNVPKVPFSREFVRS